jgi:hypothetical protein
MQKTAMKIELYVLDTYKLLTPSSELSHKSGRNMLLWNVRKYLHCNVASPRIRTPKVTGLLTMKS